MLRENWIKILEECRDRLKNRLERLLPMLNEPEPSLGVGAGGDPLKKVDLEAEKAIVDTFRKHSLPFTLISEESGTERFGNNADQCYVTTDPIDGSTNLVHHIPFYATSIAVSTEPVLDTIHTSLVTDLFHDTTYLSQKGKGSFRNARRIAPSQNESLEKAVLGMDINSYKIKSLVPRLTGIIEKTEHIRHFGANALELCYVADGTTDAFVDVRGKLRATDMAAAWLIIEEAGAKITTPEGKPLTVELDPKRKVEFVASGNSELHRILLSLMKPRREGKC